MNNNHYKYTTIMFMVCTLFNSLISAAETAPSNNTERFWLHPSFNRIHENGEKENFIQMDKSAVNYYGMRYELPWSLFEKSPGNYIWTELEKVLMNAKNFNAPNGYKVYVVLHDKTWANKNPINNNYPVPQDLIHHSDGKSHYFVKKKPAKSQETRVARRWIPQLQRRYIAAISAVAARRSSKPELYSTLEVISMGETSLAYSMNIIGMNQLKAEGYFTDKNDHLNSNFDRAKRYTQYWIDMLDAATLAVSKYAVKDNEPPLKIAMNLNWIPGQSGSQKEWLQKDILEAVKSNPLAVQAVEDVHVTGESVLYDRRIYAYTLDGKRIVPKDRVWAHLSCDTKHDPTTAIENMAQARKMAENIVIREGCYEPVDGNRFSDYEKLAAQTALTTER